MEDGLVVAHDDTVVKRALLGGWEFEGVVWVKEWRGRHEVREFREVVGEFYERKISILLRMKSTEQNTDFQA